MPIYEFHCEKCGQDSEVLIRSAKWKSTACPHCGSRRMSKKLSVFASSTAPGGADAPVCSGTPSSCCACGGGRPHRH